MKTIITIILLSFSVNYNIVCQTEKGCTATGCHQQLISAAFIHPVAVEDCTNCHESVTSEHPQNTGNSFTLIEESPELCFICHDDFDPDQKQKSIHPPFEEDCLNCHSPHASNNKYLVEETVPDLCFTCHDDPAGIEKLKSIHGAIFIEKKCLNCHSPHISSNSALLVNEEIQLCLTCHNKEIKNEERTIQNIAKKIEVEDLAHPPVVMDGCLSCHNPHASEFPFLLIDSFPESSYAAGESGNYNLCFTCHDETAFTEELTNGATEFRDGRKNLHYVHVNQDKSRSCTNCHDVHGAKNEHLIADKITFGKWAMKLNFKLTETGGSCLPGCHAEKGYNN